METKIEARIGRTIRQRRTKLGLSLGAVARRSRVDVSQLSKIERGEGGTRLDKYAKIARALSLELHELFGGKGEGSHRKQAVNE